MRAQLSKFIILIGETFWVLPAAIVVVADALALLLVALDKSDVVPAWLVASPLLYSGSATGARALLGAVASSTIGVAGTIFSITIAALSLAAGQMGPRLLRNFVRDRGNQATLGILLGTYTYALLVLRTVRGSGEGAFTPHLSLSFGVLMAWLSTGAVIFFVGHIAGRINVDTVIDLVADEVDDAVARLTRTTAPPRPPDHVDFSGGETITADRSGYLQHLDGKGLADWAAAQKTTVHLLVRPGDYVYPGAPVAVVDPPRDGADDIVASSIALGRQRISSQDLEFAIRQLEEVAVRALSPGINDPHTAMTVLQRFGAVLCRLSTRHMPSAVVEREGRPVVLYRRVTYDGLADQMFHLIRQNAAGSSAVLITGLEVMTAVASVERDGERLATLRRHAELWRDDAARDIANAADRADMAKRFAAFATMVADGPLPRSRQDF